MSDIQAIVESIVEDVFSEIFEGAPIIAGPRVGPVRRDYVCFD